MLEALGQLSQEPEHLLIDAMKLDTPIPQTSIIKGDANSLSYRHCLNRGQGDAGQDDGGYDKEFSGLRIC